MSRLKIQFDEPEHGWIGLNIFDGEQQLAQCVASRVYNSFDQLVWALAAILDTRDERSVVWLEGPAELELRFSRRDDELVQLEITSFAGCKRPREKPDADFLFVGTYTQICLPFWRALRNLEGRYSPEELWRRWKGDFPHRELALLTARLGKA